MSNQETFDIIVAHLRRQGEQSIREDNMCLYRGPRGLKCAVGILIPDDQYDPEMEGQDVEDLRCLFKGFDVNLLLKLQRVHDGYYVEDWEFELKRVAEEFGLNYEAP